LKSIHNLPYVTICMQ